MRRYKKLLLDIIEHPDPQQRLGVRELSRKIGGLSPPSILNIIHMETQPQLRNLELLSKYFGEPVFLLCSDLDDLTAELIQHICHLPDDRKQQLLETIT